MTEYDSMFDPSFNGSDRGAQTGIAVKPSLRPVAPVPADLELSLPKHSLGEPQHVWKYRNEDGRLLYQVCRWDLPNGEKQIRPLSCWIDEFEQSAWRWVHLPAPRALYGLNRLSKHPDAPVLVVEGEKTADAAAMIFPNYVAITSSGGAGAADKSDWSPLAQRNVVIWPDNDQPGSRYAADVARLARGAGATVLVVKVPVTWPQGWDLADAAPDGLAADALSKLLESAIDSTSLKPAPDMSILQRTVLPAPLMDLGTFGPYGVWLEEVAASKSAPVDYVALTLLVSAAGAIGCTRSISPWSGWEEPAILWGMLVGSPSASKSPAMDAVRGTLAEVECFAMKTWPEMQRAYETAKVLAEATRENWKEKVRSAVKEGLEEPARPPEADEPTALRMPRLVINDATIEAAASVLASNPKGLILWRDEASAWLGNLGKYGDGDRAFWLEAFGGRPYTVDRKKNHEPLQLDHVSVSIIGGIQPDRAASLLICGDDDGMAARFLYAWPECIPPCRPTSHPNNEIVAAGLKRLYQLSFINDEAGKSRPIILSVEACALDAFCDWRQLNHQVCQSASGLFASSLGKMPGQVLRIALTLELMWWAAGPGGTAGPNAVTTAAMVAAISLIEDYFKPMLERVLGEAALPHADRNARVLAQEILRRKAALINARVVRRDWRLPGLREAADVAAAINTLEEIAWLNAVGDRDGASPGRKKRDYAVDPRVHRRNVKSEDAAPLANSATSAK